MYEQSIQPDAYTPLGSPYVATGDEDALPDVHVSGVGHSFLNTNKLRGFLNLLNQQPPLRDSAPTAAHPALNQLYYCVRLHFHLAQGDDQDPRVGLRDMLGAPDSYHIQIFSGIRLKPDPAERRVSLGGFVVRGNVLQQPLAQLRIVAIRESANNQVCLSHGS